MTLFAGVLAGQHGVEKGDRVLIYMPMIPEGTSTILPLPLPLPLSSPFLSWINASSRDRNVGVCQAWCHS